MVDIPAGEEPDFELIDIEDQAEEVGFLTPREYAKLRGMSPQLVYYYIRTKKIQDERCKCGRRVIAVRAADEAIQTQKNQRGGDLAGVFEARNRAVQEGQGTPL